MPRKIAGTPQGQQCITREDVKEIYDSLSEEAQRALDEVTRCIRDNLDAMHPPVKQPFLGGSTRAGGTGFGELSGAELLMTLIEQGHLSNNYFELLELKYGE